MSQTHACTLRVLSDLLTNYIVVAQGFSLHCIGCTALDALYWTKASPRHTQASPVGAQCLTVAFDNRVRLVYPRALKILACTAVAAVSCTWAHAVGVSEVEAESCGLSSANREGAPAVAAERRVAAGRARPPVCTPEDGSAHWSCNGCGGHRKPNGHKAGRASLV